MASFLSYIDFNKANENGDPEDECATPEPVRLTYPEVRRDDSIIHTHHGIEIPNPYEFLEDSGRDETRTFVEDQNAMFQSYISKSQNKAQIRKRLIEISAVPTIGVPMKRGSRVFYWEHSGQQNHSVLYVKESMDGAPRVLLDPNSLNKDGLMSIVSAGISRNGKYVGYSLSESGSDWTTIKVRDVDCGHDMDDSLRFTKLSGIVWTRDSKGFFYQRFPPPLSGYAQPVGTEIGVNTNAKVYYHTVGTFQDDDILAIEFPDHPNWTIYTELSFDGKYLFVYASDVVGEKNAYFVNLKEGAAPKGKLTLTPLFSKPGNHWYLANDDTTLYFATNVNAPNSHIVKMDLDHPGEAKWTVIVPAKQYTIQWASVVHQDKLVICYLKNVLSKIEVRELETGNLIQERLPIEDGNASVRYGRRSDDELFVLVESYINPGTVYKVDFTGSKLKMTVFKKTQTDPKKIDLSNMKMTTLSYSSNDGANIPVILVHKKNLVMDSNRPCILTAYGGYGAFKLPRFNSSYIFFAQNFDGVVAIANIRGGGEFGKHWWDEGKLHNKQNCFDDFIAGAVFLKNNGYTRAEMLTIEGNSNGGLLIGAVINQRPEAFGAAIPQVGIMDMLRFHKFTIGHLWISEFGNPEDEADFEYIRKYSPLHNIKMPATGQYPAILATTADHDDRVVPSHTYKYISEMQYKIGQDPEQKAPIMMRVDFHAGHGAGKPSSKWIDERSEIYTFLEQALGYQYRN